MFEFRTPEPLTNQREALFLRNVLTMPRTRAAVAAGYHHKREGVRLCQRPQVRAWMTFWADHFARILAETQKAEQREQNHVG